MCGLECPPLHRPRVGTGTMPWRFAPVPSGRSNAPGSARVGPEEPVPGTPGPSRWSERGVGSMGRRAGRAVRGSCRGGGRRAGSPMAGRIRRPGHCITCSRVCSACGHPLRSKSVALCRTSLPKSERDAAKNLCHRCSRPGYLREDTGWCGHCSHPRQAKQPPRAYEQCGRARQHAGLGLGSACWQSHPDRPFVRAEHLIAELDNPPTGCRTSRQISPQNTPSAGPAR